MVLGFGFVVKMCVVQNKTVLTGGILPVLNFGVSFLRYVCFMCISAFCNNFLTSDFIYIYIYKYFHDSIWSHCKTVVTVHVNFSRILQLIHAVCVLFFASVFKSSHTNYSFKDLPNENPTIQPKLGLEKPGESSSIWFNV